jgi:4-amino-4-deoxy-L-arabinose transferase-like glycosyltransferase
MDRQPQQQQQQPQRSWNTQQKHSNKTPEDQPDDYMILSVMSLLFCNCLVGLAALLFSYKSRSAWAKGDVTAATKFSRWSRITNIIAIAIGLFILTAFVVFFSFETAFSGSSGLQL